MMESLNPKSGVSKVGFLLLILMIWSCQPDKADVGKHIAPEINTDFLALQCDRTEYVVIDTLPFMTWRDFIRCGYHNRPKWKTVFSFPTLTCAIADSFDLRDDATSSKDTIFLREIALEPIAGCLIHPTPKNPRAKVSVSLTVMEHIWQMVYPDVVAGMSAVQLRKITEAGVHWEGNQTQVLADSVGYFRIPYNWHHHFEQKRETRFALRDSSIALSAFQQQHWRLVYRHQRCQYSTPDGCLNFVVENPDGTTEQYWIYVSFSFGC